MDELEEELTGEEDTEDEVMAGECAECGEIDELNEDGLCADCAEEYEEGE